MMQKIKDTNLLLKSRKRFLLIIAVVILTIAYMTSTFSHKKVEIRLYVRISLQWYRCSGRMVPRGADAWYHLYRSDGTGTKPPLHTLSKGALQDCATGHPELA